MSYIFPIPLPKNMGYFLLTSWKKFLNKFRFFGLWIFFFGPSNSWKKKSIRSCSGRIRAMSSRVQHASKLCQRVSKICLVVSDTCPSRKIFFFQMEQVKSLVRCRTSVQRASVSHYMSDMWTHCQLHISVLHSSCTFTQLFFPC